MTENQSSNVDTALENVSSSKAVEENIHEDMEKLDLDANDASSSTLVIVNVLLPDEKKPVRVSLSMQDTVQDLRNLLFDYRETCCMTCFRFECEGKAVNNFAEINQIVSNPGKVDFKIVNEPYSMKEIKNHLLHFRDLISLNNYLDDYGETYGVNAGQSLLPVFTINEKKKILPFWSDDLSHVLLDWSFTENQMENSHEPNEIKCIDQLVLSSWHPPRLKQSLQGDLAYLKLRTRKGQSFEVTASVFGFFVNRSSETTFDARRKNSTKIRHQLAMLLSDLDPSFEENFDKVVELQFNKSAITRVNIPSQLPAAPWITQPRKQTRDLSRSQDVFIHSSIEASPNLRDWNEELQSIREMSRESFQERIMRDKLLQRTYSEFFVAATKGAMAIVDGELTPMNPSDEWKAHLFLHNNIFFSCGLDGVGTFIAEGGDDAARYAVAKDVSGVKLINLISSETLCTLATAIVDYRGKRIMCQSVLPGIFYANEKSDMIKFGATDDTEEFKSDTDFHQDLKNIAKLLRMREHSISDSKGNEVLVPTNLEMKGLKGMDGRRYFLDLYRVTPVDIEFIENEYISQDEDERYCHRLCTLRVELMDSYCEYLQNEMKIEADTQDQDRIDPQNVEAESGVKRKSESEKAAPQIDEPLDRSVKSSEDEGSNQTLFNLDLMGRHDREIILDDKERAKQTEEIRGACRFLKEKVIPNLLSSIESARVSIPIDGYGLSKLLHSRGINMRYLGYLMNSCKERGLGKLLNFFEICQLEVISRSLKYFFTGLLSTMPKLLSTEAVSRVFNLLFDLRVEPLDALSSELKALYPQEIALLKEMSKESIEHSIKIEARRRFRVRDLGLQIIADRKYALLRNVCLEVGIQIKTRDYRFLFEEPEKMSIGSSENERNLASSAIIPFFRSEDIVGFAPIVKTSLAKSALAAGAYELGRLSLQENQVKESRDIFAESVAIHETVYGVFHEETARFYYNLAMVHHQLGEKEAALELGAKAAVIFERVLGFDNEETLVAALKLALYEHVYNNSDRALLILCHILKIYRTIVGENNADVLTILNNIGLVLQVLERFEESYRVFKVCKVIGDRILEPTSSTKGRLYSQVAQSYFLSGRKRSEAVTIMRQAHHILLGLYGEEHTEVKEASEWLKSLTKNEAALAKRSQQQQRQGQQISSKLARPATASARPQPLSVARSVSHQQKTPPVLRGGNYADVSIDELVQYINEEGSGKNGASKTTARGSRRKSSKSGKKARRH